MTETRSIGVRVTEILTQFNKLQYESYSNQQCSLAT